jgi:hypothetical protein
MVRQLSSKSSGSGDNTGQLLNNSFSSRRRAAEELYFKEEEKRLRKQLQYNLKKQRELDELERLRHKDELELHQKRLDGLDGF